MNGTNLDFNKFALVLNSSFCITPNQCFTVKTELPFWITAILLGSAILIGKEIYQLIK